MPARVILVLSPLINSHWSGIVYLTLARVYRVDGPLTAWAPVDLLVGAA